MVNFISAKGLPGAKALCISNLEFDHGFHTLEHSEPELDALNETVLEFSTPTNNLQTFSYPCKFASAPVPANFNDCPLNRTSHRSDYSVWSQEIRLTRV